jgi:DNA-binding transcriptional regulator of glucitol operon
VWGAFDKDEVRVQAWWLRLIEARRLGSLFLTFRKPQTFLERLKSTVLHHRDPAVEVETDYASTEKLMALEERNRQVSV